MKVGDLVRFSPAHARFSDCVEVGVVIYFLPTYESVGVFWNFDLGFEWRKRQELEVVSESR